MISSNIGAISVLSSKNGIIGRHSRPSGYYLGDEEPSDEEKEKDKKKKQVFMFFICFILVMCALCIGFGIANYIWVMLTCFGAAFIVMVMLLAIILSSKNYVR